MSAFLLLSPWGLGVLLLAALVLIFVLVLRGWREQRLVRRSTQIALPALRVVLIAAMLWIALNPTVIEPRQSTGKPTLAVLVDTSASMNTADESNQSRWQHAMNQLGNTNAIEKLRRHFTLDIRSFDRDANQLSLDTLLDITPHGSASDLGGALTGTIADLADTGKQAGVLLISDGRATTGPEPAIDAARLALAQSVPIWTWTLGGQVPRRDVWLNLPASEVLAFADATVQLTATIGHIGYDHHGFQVQLLRDNEVITTEQITPGSTNINLTVTAPKQGEDRYILRVIPQGDEVDTQNNEQPIFVQSMGEKVRVLLVEGQPHWDTKFLVQTLKANPRVDVTALYRLSETKQFAVVSKAGKQTRKTGDLFPRSAAGFAMHDVIIMGRGCEVFFDDQTETLLTDFVASGGGGLIFSRGKSYGGRFGPLAKLEPVVWGTGTQTAARMSPAIHLLHNPIQDASLDGRLDAMLDRLPRFDLIRETVGVKPLAVIWADVPRESQTANNASMMTNNTSNEPTAIMAYHRFGQGTVVTINAGGLWRWGFTHQTQLEDDAAYKRFWLGLLRWMLTGNDFLPGHDVAMRSERRVYTDKQPLRILVRTRNIDRNNFKPKLTITGNDQSTNVQPLQQPDGSFIAQAAPMSPGTYQLTLTNNIGNPQALTTTIQIVSGSIENRILSADPKLMQHLAQLSLGQTINANDVATLPEIFTQWRSQQHLDEQHDPLWDVWWLLAIMLILLGVEWFWRRREGLL